MIGVERLRTRLAADLGWQEHAACAGTPTELWFPGRVGKGMTADESIRLRDKAASICAGCPVRAECDEFGKGERYGTWGGLTVRQRQQRRREHNRQQQTKGQP